ncbi:FAD-dependent oxidoreductase, partial [uncultured Planktosalinus sp.]|uniref:NAD(P)/FAD-dependent oxidoreductase n=1 Tax=uncultured Planktosalinus sp. TaxID=1810935 RepID=UPI0030DBD263
MNLSYWEKNTWFESVDFAIVGSGIVGLNCALSLKNRFPNSKIIVLERGILPSGASSKNAGFACFGSISEIFEDLKNHTEEEVFQLVQKRVEGLKLLRNMLGDQPIGFKQWGGHELFLANESVLFEECLTAIPQINTLLKPLFKEEVFYKSNNDFNFQNIIKNYISSSFEGQIDTGKMMQALVKKAIESNILIVNSAAVTSFLELKNRVALEINNDFEFQAHKLFVATNGFANQLLNEEIKPARAQVLITKPIDNLKIKGTFHLDKGFYYFRNINNRILFGGGRNLDFQVEETTNFGLTEKIQNQ